MVNVMINKDSKLSLTLFIRYSVIIALMMPGLTHAYGSRHYGHYGYGHNKHYGYRSYGRRSYYPYKHYGRRHYSYPTRRYNYYPKSYVYISPIYIQQNLPIKEHQYSSGEYVGANSSAWQTLAQGEHRAALNSFAIEAQSHPNSGVPKAGYALATASVGELKRGIWAMRRAFRIDPGSLHYLQLDKNGHLLIDDLIVQYSAQENTGNLDQAFMVSALHYLKQDYVAAKQAITSVEQYGDKSASFTNLQGLIDQYLSDQKN